MCPSPDIIQKYLHDDTEFNVKIREQGRVCVTVTSHTYVTIEESKNNNTCSVIDLEDLITMCQQSILPPSIL